MNDSTFDREALLAHLNIVQHHLYECAELDQRITHARHRSDYYKDLINRVDALVDAERALLKRIQTIGR